MRPSRTSSPLAGLPCSASLPLGLAVAATLAPASGRGARRCPSPAAFDFVLPGGGRRRVDSADFREGAVSPTAAQRAAARSLGATTARWNAFGTPRVLLNHRGYLSAPPRARPTDVARGFVDTTPCAVQALLRRRRRARGRHRLTSPRRPRPRPGEHRRGAAQRRRAPRRHLPADLRRRLAAAQDGLLTVGVQRDGRVAYVSSSVTGDEEVSGSRSLDAVAALQEAADDVGLDLGRLTAVEADGPWSTFEVVALPRRAAGPVDGGADAHRRHPDGLGDHAALVRPRRPTSTAAGGLHQLRRRRDRRGAAARQPGRPPRRGARARPPPPRPASPSRAAPPTPAPAPPAARPVRRRRRHRPAHRRRRGDDPNGTDDDILINLYRAGHADAVASQDLLGSPEVLTYAPAGGVPAGDYFVEVCEFTPAAGSIGYVGAFGDQRGRFRRAVAAALAASSRPTRTSPTPPTPDADTRELWCWVDDGAECDEQQQNVAARLPVGRPRAEPPDLHHARQQRLHRDLGGELPVAGHHGAAAGQPGAQLRLRLEEHLVQVQLRPDRRSTTCPAAATTTTPRCPTSSSATTGCTTGATTSGSPS